ncbi:MAG TPA: prepilin-type N-terminal cleavage/methylation domain-containing protein, partial [Planctomycetota bacterium]|nr:prepilin-type N-terminal cleavage/methylation domain-containing protein [Planctomycetota bacterium]
MTQPRGFTLLEMMIVLSITLLMMVLIVPIFQVSTRTVQRVEQKLKTYEAARMILDLLEGEIMQAVTANERGEIFSIKNFDFKDNDKFTPDFDPAKRYSLSSRRESDMALYGVIGSA